MRNDTGDLTFASYKESGLQFRFDRDRWQIRKYDDHPYFQGFSGVGLKGVDFIGVLDDEKVFLMEVKNYKLHSGNQRTREIEQSLAAPQLIIDSVEQKFEDTLSGLRAIHTYYLRKEKRFWVWLGTLLQAYIRRKKQVGEGAFWKKAGSLANENLQLQLVLWLEVEQPYREVAQQIEKGLHDREDLKAYSILVYNQALHPALEGLEVSIIQGP